MGALALSFLWVPLSFFALSFFIFPFGAVATLGLGLLLPKVLSFVSRALSGVVAKFPAAPALRAWRKQCETVSARALAMCMCARRPLPWAAWAWGGGP